MTQRWMKLAAALACSAVIVAAIAVRNRPADAAPEAAKQPAEGGAKFVVEPYLQFATRTQMTVMWETDSPCSTVVEYGATYPPKQLVKSENPEAMGEVLLAKLEPKTKYFYKVL